MKKNKRIKSLIFLVVVGLLVYMFKNNAPANTVGIFKSKQDEYLVMKSDYENMLDNIKKKKNYEDSINKLLKEINSLNVLTEIKQEQIIEILNKTMLNCNIEAISIDFSEEIPISVNNSNNKIEMLADEITNEDTIHNAVMISVQVEFKSNYNNMIEFVDELQKIPMEMVIESIRIYMENGNVHGVMDLSFYAVLMDVNI